jgi:twinkle protein
MENQPKHFHFMNLVSMLNGMPFLDGYNTRLSEADLQESINFLDGYLSVILPEENLTLESILNKAKDEIHRRGINALVIDPWNELDHQIPKNENETQYISRSLSIIRRFARKHNIHIFVVAHPTKLPKILTGGASKFQVPTPYDISGSAHWYNKADNALCVYRATPQDAGVEIHVQKIRFQAQVGRPGMARMLYNTITKRYEDGGPCPLNTKTGWENFQ